MSDLDELLRGPVARWVGRTLIAGALLARQEGRRIPARILQEVLSALDGVIEEELSEPLADLWGRELTSDIGSGVGRIGVRQISVSEAAREVDRSERYIRMLAAQGQIVAGRGAGGRWSIDLESLRSVISKNSRRRGAE